MTRPTDRASGRFVQFSRLSVEERTNTKEITFVKSLCCRVKTSYSHNCISSNSNGNSGNSSNSNTTTTNSSTDSMSLKALNRLSKDVERAYKEEKNRGSLGVEDMTLSIRDLDHDVGAAMAVSNKLEMLEEWQHLVKTLDEHKVYLQFVPALDKVYFAVMESFEEPDWKLGRVLVDAMIEAVEHSDKGVSAECRYLTVMEILSSLTYDWEFSREAEDVFRDFDREPNLDATPEEFRKDAYHLLMTLDWVPNSQALVDICGIQDDETGEQNAPKAVQSIFNQIRAAPLPRQDCIHRLLNRLTETPSATIAISSPLEDAMYRKSSKSGQGLGKTTLAAMVTSHPTVRVQFCVLWLRLNRTDLDVGPGMTYKQYIGYLDLLCEQIGVRPEWPRPILGSEEKPLQEKREEERMFQVKRDMARYIAEIDKNVLMVLDDVYDDQEIEWFWFSDRQSLLVTTTSSTLGVDWTLELETLSEDEALQLFLTEADYPSDHVLSTSIEAKNIVHRCGYHPLTIRTVARWFRLKQVTAGVVKGLEELHQELSACTAKLKHARKASSVISPAKILVEVMNLMLSPVLAAGGQPTTLMKLCLSSMVVVFRDEIPVEGAHLLWGHLLRTEPDAIHELGDSLTVNQIKRRVRFISEALTSLGLLSVTEKEGIPYMEIHHELQRVYAVNLSREMQFGSNQNESIRRWHEAFASAYLAKKVESDRDGAEDHCRNYALENLLYHMLKSGMYQKTAVLLRDERFLCERLDFLGCDKGATVHIEDCKRLKDTMEADNSVSADPAEVMVDIIDTVGTHIAAYAQRSVDEDDAEEAAEALHLIGLTLAQEGCLPQAIKNFKAALKLVPKVSSLAGTLLYSLSQAHLDRDDNEKGLKSLKECLKVMKETGEANALYAEALMLKGDALMTDCEYKDAMEHYDYALEKLYSHSANHRVEIGIALGRKGRLYQVMGDYDGAINILEECVKWKQKLNEDSCDLATVYNFLGDIFVVKDRKDEALQYYDKAYRMFELHRSDADPVDIHIINGKVDALNGDLEGCHDNFDLAMSVMAEKKRFSMERTAYDFRWIARTYLENADYARAVTAFNECLEETNDRRDDSLERAAAMFDMGKMHIRRNETEPGLLWWQESLKIRIQKVGESGIVIATLEEIGKLHLSVGEKDEALKFYTKALEVTERVYGDNGEKAADALFGLAEVKTEADDLVEALAMYEECLDIRRRTLRPTDPQIADVLEGLGKIHIKQSKFDKAYHFFIEALDARQSSMSDTDPALGTTLHYLGHVARKAGDCERALHFLLDALHIRKAFEDQTDTVATLLEIGHVHRHSRDPDSALGCYVKCVEIVMDNFGKSDALMGDVSIPLGHAKKDLCALAEDDAKAPLREEAIKAYEKGVYRWNWSYLMDVSIGPIRKFDRLVLTWILHSDCYVYSTDVCFPLLCCAVLCCAVLCHTTACTYTHTHIYKYNLFAHTRTEHSAQEARTRPSQDRIGTPQSWHHPVRIGSV